MNNNSQQPHGIRISSANTGTRHTRINYISEDPPKNWMTAQPGEKKLRRISREIEFDNDGVLYGQNFANCADDYSNLPTGKVTSERHPPVWKVRCKWRNSPSHLNYRHPVNIQKNDADIRHRYRQMYTKKKKFRKNSVPINFWLPFMRPSGRAIRTKSANFTQN